MFASRTPDTLTCNDLGMGDPLIFLDTAGFHYWMPSLARLALTPSDEESCHNLLVDCLTPERILAFTGEQRRAVASLLEYIANVLLADDPEAPIYKYITRRIRRLTR
jgi:hypothetical protein